MNHEIAMQWADALESGDYRQGLGKLCTLVDSEEDTRRWCCLGVLVDLYLNATDQLGLWQNDGGGWYVLPAYSGDIQAVLNGAKDRVLLSGFLPHYVGEWAEIKETWQLNPRLDFGDEMRINPDGAAASYLNDSRMLTFKQIAQLIRQNWEQI